MHRCTKEYSPSPPHSSDSGRIGYIKYMFTYIDRKSNIVFDDFCDYKYAFDMCFISIVERLPTTVFFFLFIHISFGQIHGYNKRYQCVYSKAKQRNRPCFMITRDTQSMVLQVGGGGCYQDSILWIVITWTHNVK